MTALSILGENCQKNKNIEDNRDLSCVYGNVKVKIDLENG